MQTLTRPDRSLDALDLVLRVLAGLHALAAAGVAVFFSLLAMAWSQSPDETRSLVATTCVLGVLFVGACGIVAFARRRSARAWSGVVVGLVTSLALMTGVASSGAATLLFVVPSVALVGAGAVVLLRGAGSSPGARWSP